MSALCKLNFYPACHSEGKTPLQYLMLPGRNSPVMTPKYTRYQHNLHVLARTCHPQCIICHTWDLASDHQPITRVSPAIAMLYILSKGEYKAVTWTCTWGL